MSTDEMEKYKEKDRQEEAGICIVGKARKDREEINPQERIKELEVGLANALALNESHQKLNGRLQVRFSLE